ncbi:MAG: PIN domain-containing protein [Dehalococcoidia bacterium]|nr:PIN domain-containing protein [Dehalococcoidia bacterium]
MSEAVLDASAVLALLNNEPGGDAVAATLPEALISAVNYAEVVGKLVDLGGAEPAIHETLEGLGMRVIPLDAELAFTAGLLRRESRKLCLSLADRCCLALAQTRHLPVMTTDRAWRSLKLNVEVRVLR